MVSKDIVQPLVVTPLKRPGDHPHKHPHHGGGGGVPEWVPEGATIFFDFVNGHYYAGGAERSASDVLSDVSLIVNGVGFVKPDDLESVAPYIIGDAATTFLELDFTAVIDCFTFTTDGELQSTLYLISIANEEDSVESAIQQGGAHPFKYEEYNDEQDRLAEADTATPGHNRVAYTRTPSRIALSVNGAAVVSDETSAAGDYAAEEVILSGSAGGYNFGRVTIYSITAYEPKSDEEIQELSQLP